MIAESLNRWARGAVLPAALAVALAGCGSAAPRADVSMPSAAETTVPTALAGWRTFTESTLGYTLSYPEDVDITAGVSPAGVRTTRLQFRVPGVDGYQGMVIRAEPNPEGHGLEEILEALYTDYLLGQAPADILSRLPQTSVAGLTSTQIGSEGDFSLVLPVGDYVYIIAPVHDMATTSLDPRALALFYQILASLQVAQ